MHVVLLLEIKLVKHFLAMIITVIFSIFDYFMVTSNILNFLKQSALYEVQKRVKLLPTLDPPEGAGIFCQG